MVIKFNLSFVVSLCVITNVQAEGEVSDANGYWNALSETKSVMATFFTSLLESKKITIETGGNICAKIY